MGLDTIAPTLQIRARSKFLAPFEFVDRHHRYRIRKRATKMDDVEPARRRCPMAIVIDIG